ncbi:VWA domain-containing protein [Candidatus Woesearchaeota archaeon]|nr:VWA domain-containing protein [Candidatus Woesearchaeota archaeon]
MRSVIENDKTTIEQGKLIADSINQGLNSFTASELFQHLVKNYSLAKSIFGETIIRRLTGHEPGTIQKNINLPEFRKELLSNIEENLEKLQDENIIDKEGRITEKGIDLAALIMYTTELEALATKGLAGESTHKKPHAYGLKDDIKSYNREKYRDISIRKTIRKAIARAHQEIQPEDLMSHKRKGKGQRHIIYCLDASGSMKGEKIEKCKKAGIALAYKAITEKDHAGLVIFGTKVKEAISPTQDFTELLRAITKAKATAQTNIAETIRESEKLFPKEKGTKHIIMITDAIPTKGEKPIQETLEAASEAAHAGITISVIGINLDQKGTETAEKIVDIGKGKLYMAKDLHDIDKIVLLDYQSAE